jgi:hypothetical protein
MLTDKKKKLGVVVGERANDQFVVLECKIESDPMSMDLAEAQALEENLDAMKRGEHIYCLPRSTPQNPATSELHELRVRLDALELRINKLEQNDQRRHGEASFALRSLSQRLSRLEERARPSGPEK